MNAPQPCALYCLDLPEGMVKNLATEASYTVEQTFGTAAVPGGCESPSVQFDLAKQ
jgi:hypothetical protein